MRYKALADDTFRCGVPFELLVDGLSTFCSQVANSCLISEVSVIAFLSASINPSTLSKLGPSRLKGQSELGHQCRSGSVLYAFGFARDDTANPRNTRMA